MRIRFPKRNLGAGENWGRSVEDEIQALRTDLTNANEANANNQKQTNAAINSLSGIISELQKTTEELAEQQAQILEIIDKLIVVQNYNSYGSVDNIYDFQWYYTGHCSVTVPEGYNACIALNVNSASGGSRDTNPWGAYVHSFIWSGSNSNYGPGGQLASASNADPGSTASVFSRASLTGLKAGDVVWGCAGIYPSIQVPGAVGGRVQVMNSLVCFFFNE